MTKQNILSRLHLIKPRLTQVGVTQLGLFGSVVREEDTHQSDIDILLDFSTAHETFNNFMDACRILEEEFKNRKVDVVTKKGLSPYISKSILREVEYV